MRKRFLMTGVAIVLALSMAGCGKSSSETTTENAKAEEQKADIVDAYKEFYNEFYNEHFSDEEVLREVDCAAKLVMDESGNLFMGITDLCSWSDDNTLIVDLYIFEYKDGEVEQKVKIPNLKTEDDGMGIAPAGDDLIVWTDYSDDKVYKISGNSYEDITDVDASGKYLGDNASYSLVDFFYSDCNDPIKYCVKGQDFAEWLDYYSENEVTSPLKFDILYAEYLENNRFYYFDDEEDDVEHVTQFIQYWKDGIYYRFVPKGISETDSGSPSTEDALYTESSYIDELLIDEDTLDNIPEDIDGIKVVVTEECKSKISQYASENDRKKSYINYFHDNSENIIYAKYALDGVIYITDKNICKICYIDSAGTVRVQELLTCTTTNNIYVRSGDDRVWISTDSVACTFYYDINEESFVENNEYEWDWADYEYGDYGVIYDDTTPVDFETCLRDNWVY